MQVLKVFDRSFSTRIKCPKQMFYHALTFSLSIVYISYFFVYLSAVNFQAVVQIYQIEVDPVQAQSILQGIMAIGGLFGAFIPVVVIPRLSRRQILLSFNLLSISLCICTLYRKYWLFIVVRFGQGMMGGLMNTIAPMLIKEISPIEMATLTGALTNLSFFFGYFMTYTFGYLLNVVSGDMTGSSTWQILFLFPVVLIVCQTVLIWRVYPYETPKYLAQKQMKQQLRYLLQIIYKDEYVQLQMKQTLTQYTSVDTKRQSVTGLYSSRTALLFGSIFAFCTQMSGLTAVIVYSKQLLASIFPALQPLLGSLTMFIYFVFAMLSLGFSEKYGRKKMTLVGACLLFLANYCIAFGFMIYQDHKILSQAIILVFFVLFIMVSTTTFGTILPMWLAQALQPDQMGYSVMVCWSSSALCSALYPIMKNSLPNQGYIYICFGTVSLLFVPFIKWLMIQTKGKLDIQIARQYKALDDKLWGSKKQTELQIEMIQKNSSI